MRDGTDDQATPTKASTNLTLYGRGGLILGLLVLINIVNFIDRQLPFILISAIKIELQLTDSQIALMAGLVFALVYAVAALPLAVAADRWSPRGVITIALAIWSLLTAISGLATNFLQLVLARMGVSASEAGCVPAAHALISRAYRSDRRAVVLAIFSVGVPIGSMLGLALGGWLSDLFSWRVAFFVVGAPGLLLAVIAWFALPKTPPQTPRGTARPSLRAAVRHFYALRSFRHMWMASALFACGSYAMNVFTAAFLIRIHNLSAAQAGLGFGTAFGVGGLIGTFVGGWLSDHLANRDLRWRQWIPAIGQLLSFPTALGAWLVPDAGLAILLLGLTYVFGLLFYAPTFAVGQSLATDGMRATATAVLGLGITVIGSSVGPMIVGWASDAWTPAFGVEALRYAMCLMGVTILWSAVHYFFAARALPADLRRTEGETGKA